MVVNDVRDFAIFLHKKLGAVESLSVVQHLNDYTAGRMLYLNVDCDWTYSAVERWRKNLPVDVREKLEGDFEDFSTTSYMLQGAIPAGIDEEECDYTVPSLKPLLSSLISSVHSAYNFFELDRRSVYLNSFSDGQLLAIYWYLLGH